MAKTDFKPFPSLEQLAERIIALSDLARDHAEFNESTAGVIERILAATTEIELKLIFLMGTIRLEHFTSPLVDPVNGKRPSVTKTAMQVYHESGKASVIQQLDALREARDAQAVSAEGADETEQAEPISNGQAGAVTFPGRISH